MIAGELENAFNYSEFFSNNNKGSADKPRENFITKIQKVGQKAGKAIDKAGGVEGIGRTVDNVRSLFRRADPATAPPSDYQFGLKQGEANQNISPDEQNKEKEKQKKEKEKLVMISVLVVSGMILIGGVIWYLNKRNQVMRIGAK